MWDLKNQKKKTIIKDFKAEIALKENAILMFCKPSLVPYDLKKIVESEIWRLCDEGIFVPVTRSKWTSLLVIVNKGNGSKRSCVNCKRTINKYVYIQRIDDIFANMAC